jgi:hypothetical protein
MKLPTVSMPDWRQSGGGEYDPFDPSTMLSLKAQDQFD